ncbi:tubulin folding cofactor c [Anaeramoeba flamelloides]|uniref:Tubulin folding cofactor c n=1 Tax=Anaeramoeba flamelloides TaxID=1746091 RepID=A0AAV8A8S5_9EUKA|nr:tubulin folding cofactor c [Anaeramoeba flamelloides]
MIDELQKRSELRRKAILTERQQQKQIQESNKNPEENAELFTKNFSKQTKLIEEAVSKKETFLSSTLKLKTDYLNNIDSEIKKLITLLSESTLFIPRYDQQTSQRKIESFIEIHQNLRSELIPKKRFKFKSRKKISTNSQKKVKQTEKEKEITNQNGKTNQIKKNNSTQNAENTENSISFKNLANEEKILNREQCLDRDIFLSNLKNCKLIIPVLLSSLKIDRIYDSVICVGPVKGSIHLESCENCVLFLASQQIRIHNANNCKFYLYASSSPIIETSSKVGFSPYTFSYPNLQNDLLKCNFDKSSNQWDNVKDFNWLRSSKSPNWYIIEENEREQKILEK